MITIPYDQICSTIIEKKGISKEELDTRIKQKMDQLSGLISKEGAAHIVANELGIKLFDATGGKMKIAKILGGMRDIETVGKVTRKFEIREFQGKMGPGKVGSFIMGDSSGQIRVVLWNDMASMMTKIEEGNILKLIGGYARQNQDRKELHLNAKSRIMINPPGETVEGVAMPEAPARTQISNLNPEKGPAEIKATIVQVFELRFYEVCPTCMRKVQQGEGGASCATHGIVTPTYSYVLNFYSDDGTGNVRTVCFGKTVENVTGKSREELLAIREDQTLFDVVRTELLGAQLILNGRANKNEMFDRIEFIAREAKLLDVDAEILKLKERVEEVQSQKSEVQSQKSEVRSPKSEVQSQKSEVRSPKSEVQSQKSEVQSQKSEEVTPDSKLQTPNSERPSIVQQAEQSEVRSPKSEVKSQEQFEVQNPEQSAVSSLPSGEKNTPNSKLQTPDSESSDSEDSKVFEDPKPVEKSMDTEGYPTITPQASPVPSQATKTGGELDDFDIDEELI